MTNAALQGELVSEEKLLSVLKEIQDTLTRERLVLSDVQTLMIHILAQTYFGLPNYVMAMDAILSSCVPTLLACVQNEFEKGNQSNLMGMAPAGSA